MNFVARMSAARKVRRGQRRGEGSETAGAGRLLVSGEGFARRGGAGEDSESVEARTVQRISSV